MFACHPWKPFPSEVARLASWTPRNGLPRKDCRSRSTFAALQGSSPLSLGFFGIVWFPGAWSQFPGPASPGSFALRMPTPGSSPPAEQLPLNG